MREGEEGFGCVDARTRAPVNEARRRQNNFVLVDTGLRWDGDGRGGANGQAGGGRAGVCSNQVGVMVTEAAQAAFGCVWCGFSGARLFFSCCSPTDVRASVSQRSKIRSGTGRLSSLCAPVSLQVVNGAEIVSAGGRVFVE